MSDKGQMGTTKIDKPESISLIYEVGTWRVGIYAHIDVEYIIKVIDTACDQCAFIAFHDRYKRGINTNVIKQM